MKKKTRARKQAPLRAEDTAVCVSLGELRAAAALEGRAALKAEPTGAEQQSSSGASASEYAVHGDGSASNDLRAAAAALPRRWRNLFLDLHAPSETEVLYGVQCTIRFTAE